MHIHQTFGTKGGACFTLCLTDKGLLIEPANAQATQVLVAESQRILSVSAAGEKRQSELLAFRLDPEALALGQLQSASVAPPADLEAFFRENGEQAVAAGQTKSGTDALIAALNLTPQQVDDALKTLISNRVPLEQQVEQWLNQAAAILDGLDISSPHRHSNEGQSAADRVLALLTQVSLVEKQLSARQMIRLTSLCNRLRAYGREVQA